MQTILNTQITKDKWTDEHFQLFNTIPPIIKNIANDLFEIKWYGGGGYNDMLWEIEHNIYGKDKLKAFKEAYDGLSIQQKNLIYYAYDA